MNEDNLFTVDEQIEIIRIVKGIFCYAKKNRKILSTETLLLELLESTCDKVSFVIKDRNKK